MKALSFSFLILLFFQSNVFAEETPVQKLKIFLNNTKSLTADFKQVLLNEAGDPYQTSYGQFYLQRPGKFRWDYTKPFKQQIVSKSGKVWFYDNDLEQVTIKKLDESVGSTPALLLTGDANLDDNYIMQQQESDGNMESIRLAPKSKEGTFKYILIGLENGSLAGMELNDNFGQLTRIYFSNIKINKIIDSSVFEFKAPSGADVFSE